MRKLKAAGNFYQYCMNGSAKIFIFILLLLTTLNTAIAQDVKTDSVIKTNRLAKFGPFKIQDLKGVDNSVLFNNTGNIYYKTNTIATVVGKNKSNSSVLSTRQKTEEMGYSNGVSETSRLNSPSGNSVTEQQKTLIFESSSSTNSAEGIALFEKSKTNLERFYKVKIEYFNAIALNIQEIQELQKSNKENNVIWINESSLQTIRDSKIPFTIVGGMTRYRVNSKNLIKRDREINDEFEEVEASEYSPTSESGLLEVNSGTIDRDIPDNGWTYYGIRDSDGTPDGAETTNLDYRLRIYNKDVASDMYCGDYEIYLSSTTQGGGNPHYLVYNNLGNRTDGGYDDDSDDDYDIYINRRSTTHFNGEDPNQYWYVYIIDTMGGDTGHLQYIEWDVYWEYETLLPDLTSPSMAAQSTTVEEGESFYVRALIENEGDTSAGSSSTRAWLSIDNDFDTSDDYSLGVKSVPSLGVSDNTWIQWDFTMPNLNGADPGVCYDVWLLVEVDYYGDVLESNENNLYKSTNSLFQGADPIQLPDIDVQPSSLSFSDTVSNGVTVTTDTTYSPEGVDRTIKLKKGDIIPYGTAESVTTEKRQSVTAQAIHGKHQLMQFDKLLTPQDKDDLEDAGIKVLRYIPNNTYWVSIADISATNSFTSASQALGKNSIYWVGDLEANYKVAEALDRDQIPPNRRYSDGSIELTVLVFADVEQAQAETVLNGLAGVKVVEWLNDKSVIVRTMPDRIRTIAAEDIVEWAEPAPAPHRTMNDTSSQRIHVNEIRNAPLGLDANAVTVGVWDEGEVFGHDDFGSRLTVVDSGTVSDHSTHVAGTVGGSGAGNANATGMATAVNLRSYDWDSDDTEMRANAGTNVDISNHSYGTMTGWELIWNGTSWVWQERSDAGFGDYGSQAIAWDDIVVDTGLIIFKAAGNDRNDGPDCPTGPQCDGDYDCIGHKGNAKNVITIGATTDADAMTTFSSWGPTDDGRVKPDLCANGHLLLSTMPDNEYDSMSGTSMATPSASGAAALLFEHFEDTHGAEPTAAEMKALLIQGAEDLGRTGPDYTFGWGLINAETSGTLISGGNFISGTVTQTGNVLEYSATVGSGLSELKISLVWTDPAGSAVSAVALVNDLDLVLIDPSGNQHQPWVLDGTNPTINATRGRNSLDNVEQVLVENPAAGTWTVRVSGNAVPDGHQDYTLAGPQLAGGHSNSLTISNVGSGTLIVTSIAAVSGSCWLSLSHDNPPVNLAGGESTVVSVTVDGTCVGTGNHTDTIRIASNDPDESNVDVPVSLQVAEAPEPDLVVSEPSPDVAGPYVVGQTVDWGVSISNQGNIISGESAVGYYLGTSCGDLSNRVNGDNVNPVEPGTPEDEHDAYTFQGQDIGTRYKIVKADYHEEVDEQNEDNNTACYGPFTVGKADTITTIISDSPDPSVQGQQVQVSYTVTVQAPGGGTPTGNVTVSADTGESCVSTVTGGSCMLTLNQDGERRLIASYDGADSFRESTSSSENHTVTMLDTDNDGISDTWEIDHVPQGTPVGTELTLFSASGDYDNDGYTDLQEYLNRNELDLLGAVYDPLVANAPHGTGYKNSATFLPAVLQLLLY